MSQSPKNPITALYSSSSGKPDVFTRLTVIIFVIIFAFFGYLIFKKYHPSSNCLVIPTNYCTSGKLTVSPNNQTLLGFNLPKGSEINSPFDGTFVFMGKARSDPSFPDEGRIDEPRSSSTSTYSMYFFAEFKPLVKMGSEVTKGEPIAQLVTGNVIDEQTNSNFLAGFEKTFSYGAQMEDSSALSRYFEVKP